MTTRKATRRIGGALALLWLSVLAGCGGGVAAVRDPSRFADLTPAAVTLTRGATQQFAAPADNPVQPVWEILQGTRLLDDGSGGTITPTGLYTAPKTAGTFRVRYSDAKSYDILGFATVTVQ